MKLIAIEEHFLTKAVKQEWETYADPNNPTHQLHFGEIESRLDEIGDTRLRLMNETGVDVQVLSLTSPSLHNLGPDSLVLARLTNDYLAQIIRKTPERFQGLAALPMAVANQAANELTRSVTQLGLKGAMVCGRTGRKILTTSITGNSLNAQNPSAFPCLFTPKSLKNPSGMLFIQDLTS